MPQTVSGKIAPNQSSVRCRETCVPKVRHSALSSRTVLGTTSSCLSGPSTSALLLKQLLHDLAVASSRSGLQRVAVSARPAG